MVLFRALGARNPYGKWFVQGSEDFNHRDFNHKAHEGHKGRQESCTAHL